MTINKKTMTKIYNQNNYSADSNGSYYAAWRKLVVKHLGDTVGASSIPIDKVFDMRFVGESDGEARVEM